MQQSFLEPSNLQRIAKSLAPVDATLLGIEACPETTKIECLTHFLRQSF